MPLDFLVEILQSYKLMYYFMVIYVLKTYSKYIALQ